MKVKEGVLCLLAALLLAPACAYPAASALGLSVAVNRMVTPNGDGRNDTFVFRCHNPRDSAVEGKIFDLSGREVALMKYMSAQSSVDFYYDMEWDPNAGGRQPGGVYVYQVRVESKVYKGTIVVIR